MSVCLESRAKLDAKQICDHVNELRKYDNEYTVFAMWLKTFLILAHRLWSCNCRYHTVVNFVSSPITFSPPTVDTQECMTSKKTRRKTLQVNMFLVSTIITNHTKPHKSGYWRMDFLLSRTLSLPASAAHFFPGVFLTCEVWPPFLPWPPGRFAWNSKIPRSYQTKHSRPLTKQFSKIMVAISPWRHWVHQSTSLHFPAMPFYIEMWDEGWYQHFYFRRLNSFTVVLHEPFDLFLHRSSEVIYVYRGNLPGKMNGWNLRM